ncbi:MAG: amidohydrolase [Saprospiraceae bacterium]
MKHILLSVLFLLLIFGCTTTEDADLIIINANVYTVNTNHPKASAIAVRKGIILEVGDDNEVLALKGKSTKVIDAHGEFVMPGWIEGHGHFSGLGNSLQNLNFIKSKNWAEIVSMVDEKVKLLKPGEWVVGRGWHQEKWNENPGIVYNGYPDHSMLSDISPNNPVILYHASGHALFANAKAMKVSNITIESPNPIGGAIVRDDNGDAIGVFEEKAMYSIYDEFKLYIDSLDQEKQDDLWYNAIKLAQQECLKNGITSFQDAGSKFFELERYEELAIQNKLDLRLWAMVRHSSTEMKGKLSDVKANRVGSGFYTCNAIKSEIDGALGAFGAWLLKPYTDKPESVGQNTTDIMEVKQIAELALEHDMQFCVHAIGDRANRVVVDIYEGMLHQVENGNKKRWRIEHAQHLDPVDIPRFAKNGIIASMQGIHCTSDAPFVEKRLGNKRSKLGAYAWRSLLDNGVVIANGTDAPVEDVNPIPSYYASVTRKRVDNEMEFFIEQRMTRAEALYSYTLGNAYAAFEDDIKGSIEVGKVADIVIMNTDIINCNDAEILDAKVLYTIVDGKVKYKK